MQKIPAPRYTLWVPGFVALVISAIFLLALALI